MLCTANVSTVGSINVFFTQYAVVVNVLHNGIACIDEDNRFEHAFYRIDSELALKNKYMFKSNPVPY